MDPKNYVNIDSASICRPEEPVLLCVHYAPNKPDYQVKIRRQTTPMGIPPVIMGKVFFEISILGYFIKVV